MEDLLKRINEKKKEINRHKSLPKDLTANIDNWYKVELTYSSNAIEGNTLTRQQTVQVIEKGITVAGKSIVEHLEAINHAKAYQYIRDLNYKNVKKITTKTILDIHSFILKDINMVNAGIYRSIPVRIAGSTVVLPNPIKVPDLMDEFIICLHKVKGYIVKIAVDAHFKLVTIHPFVDGNGRVARLVLNLILQTAEYPSMIIKKEDRNQYINSLEKGQLTGDLTDYYLFMFKSINRSCDLYLDFILEKKKTPILSEKKLFKIGEIAKLTGETIATIRFWTKQGLLKVEKTTKGGYQLYTQKTVEEIKRIRKLQREKRYTLNEIKKII